jgi:arylsulfatase A-like enzyme
MSIASDMTDNDLKLSESPNLNEEQTALFNATFGEGNAAYAAADLEGDDDVRWRYQRYIKSYVASVTSMDRQIGRLLDYLQQRHLLDNTIVIYTSDQGFFLGENGWFDKRWMDEVSSRIPLLVQWSGTIAAGTSTEALVQNIDLAPTLLDAAGIIAPRPMHGVSLLPLAREPQMPWERDLYYHFYEKPGFHGVARHYGVLTERYKLIHYYQNDEWELFDRQTDPGDQYNLYGKPGTQAITAQLEERLAALRAQYKVPETDPEVPWYHGPLIRTMEKLLRLL